MTGDPMDNKNLWPVVAMVGLALAAIVAILALVPEDNATAATAVMAIVTLLGTLVSALVITNRVNSVGSQVGEVHQKVNGHLSALTAKIPDAQQDQVSS